MIFNKIALAYLVIFIIAPPMASANIYRIVALLMMLYLVGRNVSKCITRYTVSMICAVALMTIIEVICGESITVHIQLYLLMSFVIVLSFLYNEQEVKSYNYLVTIIFATYIIFNITTIRALNIDPHIMRSLAKNSSLSSLYQDQGVGGYGYLYAMILVIPIGIFKLRQETGLRRIVTLIFLITSYVLVFSSAYMLAMLITICMTGAYIALSFRNRNSTITVFLIITAAVILYYNLDSLLLWIADLTRPSMIQKKVEDMYEILFNDVSVEDTVLWGRYERYLRDIMLILNSPIWGTLRYSLVGKHSAILDLYAQFGIPIGIYATSAIFKPLKKCIRKNRPELIASFIGLVLYLLLNSPAMSVGVLYFIFPLIFRSTNNGEYIRRDE